MDNVISFLEDNYIYVAIVGLIIIIILIGFLSSRHKGKNRIEDNEKEKMVNLNDVHTGEINQVADAVKQNEMKPVDVAPMPTTDALKVEPEPATPVMEEVKPIPSIRANDVNLEKTEIMDFSDFAKPSQPTDNQATINPNASQYTSNEGSILNGEETEEPEEEDQSNHLKM